MSGFNPFDTPRSIPNESDTPARLRRGTEDFWAYRYDQEQGSSMESGLHFVVLTEADLYFSGWVKIGEEQRSQYRVAIAVERLCRLLERGTEVSADVAAQIVSGIAPEVARRVRRNYPEEAQVEATIDRVR